MKEQEKFPAAEIRICKDKMKVTITNIYPLFRQNSEQGTRQEISARLCRIFKKYE